MATLVTVALAANILWTDSKNQYGHLLEAQISNMYLVQKVGILNYHAWDLLRFTVNKLVARRSINPSELQQITDYFRMKKRVAEEPLLPFGKAAGKNVIFLQVESLEDFVIGLNINQIEITPFLNSLVKESWRFVNFSNQTYKGHSSDADFMVLNSLYPARNGSAAYRFTHNEFVSLPKILRQHGYLCFSTSAEASLWNKRTMHRAYGFDPSFFIESLEKDELINGWLSDGSFLKQTAARLARARQPFFAYIITATSHHPYRAAYPAAKWKPLGLRIDQDSMLYDYLQAMHYLDHVLKVFIEDLRAVGLLDNSVIFLYGDHGAALPPEDMKKIKQDIVAPYSCGKTVKIPLFIRMPGQRYGKVLDTWSGHIDLPPTLLHILGIPPDNAFFLGKNLFSKADDSLVSFANGSFVSTKYGFSNRGSSLSEGDCYDIQTCVNVDFHFCQEGFEKTKTDLSISNTVLEQNLLPRLRR